MADKENETKVSKLRRKFSRKAQSKTTTAVPSPVSASPVSVRSATLPLSCDPKSLALHESHSEGLFSKLRRRFRFGSKGKYDLKTYTENSPSKPKWLRRKSEETQSQDDEDNLSLGVESKITSVGKSNSVKTQRKSKSDKEEVILIRKDKRVSVICKTENGESEVIFSNAENVDEDLSETTSEMDEDPYATISSVKEQIAKKNRNTKVVNKQNGAEMPCGASANNNKVDTEQANKIAVDIDEYPYAKIDTSKKKLLAVSQPSLEARSLPRQTCVRVRSQIEPDYETLDDIKQKKNEFRSHGNMHSSFFEAVMSDPNLTLSAGAPGVLDPDYECLEDVKQRCVSSNMSAHSGSGSVNQTAITCINNAYQPSDIDKAMLDNSGVRSPHSHDGSETSSSRLSPALGASPDSEKFLRRLSAASSQGSRPASMSSPRLTGRTSSSLSPSAVAPLAPSVDSSLPNDTPSHQQASPQEECLYDNPNIILRKQVTRSITNASTLSRRGNTHSEPPVIKTPAEEELVEKLSALLAPPLPLRNYQKDEVHPRSGTASARHSWSSQGSRSTETGEFGQSRDIDRSPITSLNHSRENLIMKSVKDSLMNQVYERHDFFSRSNGADLLRKRETSSLEKYLRKTSPQAMKSNKLLDKSKEVNKCDYSTVNKVQQTCEENISVCQSPVKEIKNDQTHDVKCISPQGQLVDNSGIVTFCHDLVKNIIDDICKQSSICDSSFSLHPKQTIFSAESQASQELISLPVTSEKKTAKPVIKNTEITESLAGTEFGVPSHTGLRSERCAKFVSAEICHIKESPERTSLANSENAVSDQVQHELKEETDAQKEDKRSVDLSNRSMEDKPVGIENVAILYNLQGARPKVRPLLLEPVTSSLLEVHGGLENTNTKSKNYMNGIGEPKLEVEKNSGKQFSQDSPTWDETLSPMFSDMDFHDSIEEDISQYKKSNMAVRGESMKKSGEDYNGKYFENSDPSIQETVYVDSDSDNEFGLDINKKITVHVRRNQCISRVAKPSVYANPRLLENVISGAFKKTASLDTAYLAHGVFRWGRYFPALGKNRQAVDAKLKALFNFILEMLFSPSRLQRNQYRVKKLQEEVDKIQRKIERRLKTVQDLPTFQDIRLQLLKTETVDDWELEKPVASYFDHSEGHQDFGRINNERARDRNLHDLTNMLIKSEPVKRECSHVPTDSKQCSTQDFDVGNQWSAQDFDVGNMLHSDDSFSEVDEVFCVFGNGQSVMNLPNSPTEVLDEFVQLSKSRLKCKYCYIVEESDSEDEMVAVETYAKTVSASVCPQLNNRVDYIAAGSLCRAFHGELAYTSYMRKHRTPTKLLTVPGPGYQCGGSESHLSWNNWCCLDALFTKLVPHISPRLDFQYLLRTYAEFKYFVLIDRERNLEHKGCFVKRSPKHILKCCRFEEFVFLKIIRDEIRHFSHIFSMSRASRDLFLEERDVGFSLLSLLRIVLRNIHKMRRSLSKEEVGVVESKGSLTNKGTRIYFRHSAFQKWSPQEDYFTDPVVSTDQQRFHIRNFENFRFGSLSQTLRNWKSPQAYVHDPNVLASCRTLFSQPDTKGVEEPKPLQEQQDFVESMEQLQLKDWYWGPISYEQATLILKDKEDGSFLVRDSSDQKYLLSLSFKSLGEVHHTRIEHAKGLFSFWSQPESHGKARICEFIEKSIQNSRDGRFLYFLRPSARGMPPLPIRLLTPVSRNFRVATLKHLSRFVVRQAVRKDHLDLLPVPEKVKRYLRDKQYYVEILDDDQWAFDGDYGKSSK